MRGFLVVTALALPLCAQNPITDTVKSSYGRVRQNLVETAEVMPEADYAYKLSPAQRPFGEWISHTAVLAYNSCAAMQGVAAPPTAAALHGLTSKADLVRSIRESLEYCDAAFKVMDDKKAATEVSIGDRKLYPITPMIGLVTGLNEHYGNLVGYMRTKGIVPPSSARATTKK